ncbi:hypothetical protein [Streptomyces sp. NPDC048295]|uniref:hypothetical protein n=1 Tax=Streptomyces sp. NPDC048295 TaxID=3154617 RepID=UPI0034365465
MTDILEASLDTYQQQTLDQTHKDEIEVDSQVAMERQAENLKNGVSSPDKVHQTPDGSPRLCRVHEIRERCEQLLGPAVIAHIEAKVAAAPPPPPELIDELRRIVTQPPARSLGPDGRDHHPHGYGARCRPYGADGSQCCARQQPASAELLGPIAEAGCWRRGVQSAVIYNPAQPLRAQWPSACLVSAPQAPL